MVNDHVKTHIIGCRTSQTRNVHIIQKSFELSQDPPNCLGKQYSKYYDSNFDGSLHFLSIEIFL